MISSNLKLLDLSNHEANYIKNFLKTWNDTDVTTLSFTTSGTSGKPKEIIHTKKTLQAAALKFIEITKLNKSMIQLDTFPVGSIASITMVLLPWILTQHKLYVSKFNPFTYLDLFQKIKPTIINTVPSMLHILSQRDIWPTLDLKDTIISVGSDYVSNHCFNTINDKNGKFIHIYGLTEVPPPCLYSDNNKFLLCDDDVIFKLNNGTELSIGWKSQQNLYDTNDLFEKKGDKLFFKGRKNFMFKYKKSFVNPELIEAKLKDKNINNCLCKLENNFVTIYYESDQVLCKKDITAEITNLYPEIKKINLIKIDNLQKNSMHKIVRNQLTFSQ